MARGSIQTREWLKQLTYVHFERVTLLCIMFLVGVIAVYAMILATIDLVSDIWVSHSFLEKEALQDTFGHILTIVILLEFNHSIYVALTERAGAIQTRIVVLIGVLVVARKLMLQDFATLDVQALLGFGGLLLALGGLYWLLSDADGRRAQSASQEQRPGA
ncbi:MAG: phosphate-starvation-inducible PsiE family protein [Pseudolabrys sp.]